MIREFADIGHVVQSFRFDAFLGSTPPYWVSETQYGGVNLGSPGHVALPVFFDGARSSRVIR